MAAETTDQTYEEPVRPWRPMGQTEEEAGTLYEGLTPWMELSYFAWLQRILTRNGAGIDVDFVDKYERQRRAREPITTEFSLRGVAAFRDKWGGPWGRVGLTDEWLEWTDYCIWERPQGRAELEAVLLECGSAWKVGTRDGHPGLERRVPLGVQEAADEVMANAGRAGERLSGAWRAAFGVNPDPSKAYALAVKAVEDASVPVAAPNDKVPTLGKVTSNIRTQTGWELPFAREDEHVTNHDTIVAMLKTLWAGQADRHGGSPDPDLEITQEAAEAAVMLAVPLVQWFHSGAAARH